MSQGPIATISRANWVGAVTIDSTVADCTVVDVRNYAGGSIHIPNASSVTTITFYGLQSASGTFVACYDNTNTAVTLTVAADRVVQLPDAVFAYSFIKLAGNTDGTGTLFLKG